jgi:predicted nucleic acid-binding protein
VARTVFVDTSFVLALENRDDPHHARAKQLDCQLVAEGAMLLLHWGILLETGDGYAQSGRRVKGMVLLDKFVNEEGFKVLPLSQEIVDEAVTLFRSRPDKEWVLTDCVSFVLMQREGVKEALTADAHFRQAGFEAILLEWSASIAEARRQVREGRTIAHDDLKKGIGAGLGWHRQR